MYNSYTSEKHTRILIALMKEYGIKKVIISPGATNICFAGSLQSDPYFELFSSVDERSAGFIAVGMAAESGEPVALSCTGSTASRNYIPALTEAFYRQLPILAVTASQNLARIGQNLQQAIDRSSPLADIVKESVTIDVIHTPEEEWQCVRDINKALISLKKNGGGPAHINLVTTYSRDFSHSLPNVKTIRHIASLNEMPKSLNAYKRITIFVGCHSKWSEEIFNEVEKFCETHNAVVSASHSGNYKGDYGYNPALVLGQREYVSEVAPADLAIYIGSIPRYPSGTSEREMWRVNPDGKIRDVDKKLTKVFEMREVDFFKYYNGANNAEQFKDKSHDIIRNTYANELQEEYQRILEQAPELPFSNAWIAQQTMPLLPKGCVLHLAGSNTARAWNFFPLPKSIDCYTNDGTMGIDGQVSALIGESLANPYRVHIGVVGDLTFFYDMNSLGNRHIRSNLRLMVINNGKGAEFKIYTHPASVFGDDADAYIAASGHFGNQSRDLVRHYAEDLGYEYLCADSKESFTEALKTFVDPEMRKKSIIFEVFTDSAAENEAIYLMNHIAVNMKGKVQDTARSIIRRVAGEGGINTVKNLLKK